MTTTKFAGLGIGDDVKAPGCRWLSGKVVRRFVRGGIKFITLKFGNGRKAAKRTFQLDELLTYRRRRLELRESERAKARKLRAQRKDAAKQGGR